MHNLKEIRKNFDNFKDALKGRFLKVDFNELKNLKTGDHTNPILVPGGFLILKLLDLREISRDFDFDKEVKKIVRKKKNQQLNRFSNIYFNKVNKDITINEF